MINKQDFLKPETRCDFFVSEKRKKVWQVELDILEDFIHICQRHNLKYFLFAGSLLGAVRHQGIIPWDDDIDVGMPREDYEKFLRVAPGELQEQHVLANHDNTEGFYSCFSKILNKNTAALEEIYWKYGFSHLQGIFLDVFPFDNVPDSKIGKRLHHYRIQFARALLLMKKGHHVDEKKYGKLVTAAFYGIGKIVSRISMEKLSNFHRKVITGYNKRDTKLFSFVADGHMPNIYCLKEWVEELVDAPFEYLTVKIPKESDAYLTSHFGNWHKFVRGGSCHNGIFFDPERPYTEYLHRFEEFKDAPREL